MQKKYLSVFIIFTAILFMPGCNKIPEKIQSPSIKIDLTENDNGKKYTVRFSGGIKNENSDTAFIGYKGNVVLADPSKDDKAVDSLSFSFPVILPFDSGIINIKAERSEEEVMQILELLNLSREKLIAEKSVERFNIDEKFIKLDTVTYKTRGIVKLLKDRLNEKN